MLKRAFLINAVSGASAFILILGLTTPGHAAACVYFRSASHIHSCKSVSVNFRMPEGKDPSEEFDQPVEVDDGRRIRLVCSCDYSLSGSDLRCDLDRTEEYEVLLVSSDVRTACAASKKPCDTLCPTRLP
jgi:hypothetical protein